MLELEGGTSEVRLRHQMNLAVVLALLAATPAANAQSPSPAQPDEVARPEIAPTSPPIEVGPAPEVIDHRGPPLSLQQALAAASARSLTVRQVEQQIAQAEGTLTMAWSAFLPRISAQATYTILDTEREAELIPPELAAALGMPPQDPIVLQPQTNIGATGTIAMPLFHFESFANLENARAAREASRLGVTEARRQIQLAVARAYYGILSAHRFRDLQVRARQNAVEHLRNAEARLQAGVGLRLDVTRSAMEVEQTSSAILAAQALEEDAYDALAALLDRDEPFQVVEPPPPTAPAPSVDDLVGRAVAERTDQRLARLQTEIADRAVTAAHGPFVPTLDLAFNLTYTEFVGQFSGGDHVNWNVVFVLGIPIYDGGLRYGTLEERRAALRAAELREQELARSASVDIRKAHRAWRTSIATVDTARRQVALAAEALRLATAAYEAGASTNLEVVDAQRQQRDAEANLVVTTYDSQVALATLLLQSGMPLR